MDPKNRNADAALASLAVAKARVALEKIKFGSLWNRFPAGSKKGGQFAPKGQTGGIGGGGGKNLFPAEGGSKGNLPGGSPAPQAKPSNSKPHPKVNDKGQPVEIKHPSRASHKATWSDHKAVATFTPGGETPKVLNGVKMSPWAGPKNGDWTKVQGTDPSIDADDPFVPTRGKSVGAGVVVLEPDGRVWMTKPTNEFGGYANTYPKGTAEPGLSLQQNAIKEAWEETGLQVKIVGVLGDYERSTSRARFYIAERVGGTPSAMGWESQAVRLSPLSEARKLFNTKVDKDILDDIEHLFEISKLTKSSWAKQPRWPRGSALGGQWKTVGADGLTMPPVIAGGLMGKNAVYQKATNAAHAMAQAGDISGAKALMDKYAAANDKFAAKQLTSSHVKWGAQAHQYATQLSADYAGKSKAAATAFRISGPEKLSSFTYAAPKPGGSNPGAIYTDPAGDKWLVKGNAQLASGAQGPAISEMRARNEVLAAKLLLAAGVGAPEMKLVDLQGQHGGDLGVASKMIDHKKFNPTNPEDVQKAQADFAAHAWLGNYDVLGMGYDNTVFALGDGKAVNIDPGGALLFRAQGALKNPSSPLDGLKKDAPEFETMRSTSSEQKAVFGKMTASQLAASAEKLKSVTDAQIKDLVNTYGPGDEKMRAALADRLIERRDAILQKAAVAAPAPAAPVPPTTPATPAKPAKAGFTAADVMAEMNKVPDESGFSYADVKMQMDKVTAQMEKTLADNPDYAPLQNLGSASAFMQAYLNNPKQNKFAQATAAHAVIAQKLDSAYNSGDLFATVKANLEAKELAYSELINDGKAPIASQVLTKVADDKVNFLAYEKAVAAKKILEQAQPLQMPPMPVFTGKFPKANEFYNDMAKAFKSIAESGDLAALKQAATGGKYPGGVPWKPGFANGEKMAKYHAGLVAVLEQKNAAGVMAGAQLAQEALKPVSPTVAPPVTPAAATPAAAPAQATISTPGAMPDFVSKLMPGDSSNAKSNNTKVLALKILAEKGDVQGLLALAYGSNTYGKQHVKLANDALAALGSPHKVVPSQKKGEHPALNGGATPQQVAVAAATLKMPAPPPPKVIDESKLDVTKAEALNVPTFSASSKAWINDQNNQLAKEINALYQAGNLTALKAMTFPEISYDTGLPTGAIKPLGQAKAKNLTGMYDVAVANLTDIANPPQPLKHFNAATATSLAEIDARFPSKPMGTVVSKQPKNEQLGYFLALGKVEGYEALVPKVQSNLTQTAVQEGYTKYKSATPDAKKFMMHMQNSGAFADAYRKGNSTYNDGSNLEKLAVAALAHSTAHPAGTKVYRWSNMPTNMIKMMLEADSGTVFQATGPMPASYDPVATKGFGSNRMEIVFASGARGVDSFGSTNFSSEKEVTMLPNSRFVLLSSKKLGVNNVDIKVLMLPPDLGITKKP